MVRKSKQVGGDIPYMSNITPVSQQLLNTHIDKRILPVLNNKTSRNVSIRNKYYDVIPPVGNNMASSSQSFTVNADSASMISLSESYFVVNCSLAAGAGDGLNYAPFNFAPHLFCDNINTKISAVDVSDIHNNGLYAYSAFSKKCLMKEYEGITTAQPYLFNLTQRGSASVFNVTDPQGVVSLSNETVSSATTFETIGDANMPCNDYTVNTLTADAVIKNTNAYYYSNLIHNFQEAAHQDDTFEFRFKPTDGIWGTEDYLPTSVQMQMLMTIADLTKFVGFQTGNDKPVFTLNSVNLFLCRVIPTEDALVSVNSMLNEVPFVYPVVLSRTESYQIQASANGLVNLAGCLQGIIPNCIIINIINSGATTLNRTAAMSMINPLSSGRLQPDGVQAPIISKLWCNVGSQKYPQNSQYLCNKTSQNIAYAQDSYNEYRKNCINEMKPFLTYNHWLKQYNLFVINTTNDDSAIYSSTDETRLGSTTLYIEFDGTQTAANYTVVLTALSHAEVSVDKSRNVIRNGY